jgi:LmbE family N-acetylglucosaminyl deacetylase
LAPERRGSGVGRQIVRRLLFRLVPAPRGPLGFTDTVVSERGRERPTKLMIVAHPDDESLFGGEALTSGGGWNVVCVTNAANEARRREFTNAMRSVGASFTMLGHQDHLHNPNFNPRLVEQLRAIASEHPYELVVTHGPAGEYGHPQHRALHHIVRALLGDRPLHVFDPAWLARPHCSAAKRALLAHYASQQRSIAHRWFLVERERLRRVQ